MRSRFSRFSVLVFFISSVTIAAFAWLGFRARLNTVPQEKARIKLESRISASAKTLKKEAAYLASLETRASHEEAIKKYLQALSLYQEKGNTDKAAWLMIDLAESYRKVSDLETCAGYNIEAAAYFEETQQFAMSARLYIRAGLQFDWLKEYDQALHFYSLGKFHYQKSDSTQGELFGNALLGNTYQVIGQTSLAKDVMFETECRFKDIQAQWPEKIDEEFQQDVRFQLASYYYELGYLELASEHYAAIYPIAIKNDYRYFAFNTLNNLGIAYSKLGKLKEAESALNLAVDQLEDRNYAGMGAVQINLSQIDFILGDRKKAWRRLIEAEKLFNQADLPEEQAGIQNALGNFYKLNGLHHLALAYYKKSLNSYRQLKYPRKVNRTLLAMGETLEAQHDLETARTHYLEAYQTAQEMENREQILQASLNLGGLNLKLGNYSTTLHYFEKISEDILEQGDPELLAKYYQGQFRVNFELAEIQKADAWAQKALKTWRGLGDLMGQAYSLNSMAQVQAFRRDFRTAIKLSEEALTLLESVLSRVAGHQMQAFFFSEVRDLYTSHIALVLDGGLVTKDEIAKSTFLLSEKSRTRGLINALYSHDDVASGEIDLDAVKRLRQLFEQYRVMAPLMDAESLSQLESEMGIYIAKVQESEFMNTSVGGSHPFQLDLNAIQSELLSSDTVLLSFLENQENFFMWLVTNDNVEVFPISSLKEVTQSARMVWELVRERAKQVRFETTEERALRLSIADERFFDEAGKLSKILFSHVAQKIKNKKLIIVPDGALYYLPFSALPSPHYVEKERTYRPLIMDHEVVISPSAAATLKLKRMKESRKISSMQFAAFADPVFRDSDSRIVDHIAVFNNKPSNQTQVVDNVNYVVTRSLEITGRDFMRLPHTKREVDSIAQYFNPMDRQLYLGFEASLQNVLDNGLGQFRIIHFATHGFANSMYPELSGLMLSRFNEFGETQFGFLSLSDIYGLRLNADLVVLSACETVLGQSIQGAGLMGLARGFLHVGAVNVIGSLWRVEDHATADLMECTYQSLINGGLAPSAALREAQIKMFNNLKSQSPYFWAGFESMGF